VEENLIIWVRIKNVSKKHPFASHFQEEDFNNSRDFVDRLEEVLNEEGLEFAAQSGKDPEDRMAKKSKKRRRRAGRRQKNWKRMEIVPS